MVMLFFQELRMLVQIFKYVKNRLEHTKFTHWCVKICEDRQIKEHKTEGVIVAKSTMKSSEKKDYSKMEK